MVNALLVLTGPFLKHFHTASIKPERRLSLIAPLFKTENEKPNIKQSSILRTL